MKTAIALFGILLSQPLLALEAPKIVGGDYLLVYARIVDCGPELQAIDAGQVDEDGNVTLLGNVSLVAKDKPVHEVRNELVDVMEKSTGHRSKSLELVHISGGDKEAVTRRLVMFSVEVKHRCPRIVLPPGDLDPNWEKGFERLVRAPHDKSSNTDACRARAA